jgi:hypothetical protein
MLNIDSRYGGGFVDASNVPGKGSFAHPPWWAASFQLFSLSARVPGEM